MPWINDPFARPDRPVSLSDALGGPSSAWTEDYQALWRELRFAIAEDVALEKHRVGFGFLVDRVAQYRQARDVEVLQSFARTLRRELVRELWNWGVPHGQRGRVVEGLPGHTRRARAA